MVNAVSTPHHDHSFGGREHIISANWTIALSGTLNAAMSIFDGDRQTNTAGLILI